MEEDGLPGSLCTCPYGTSCKHAVAALLEYLKRLKAAHARKRRLIEILEHLEAGPILQRRRKQPLPENNGGIKCHPTVIIKKGLSPYEPAPSCCQTWESSPLTQGCPS
ncbi:MAG TPA: hypothetical protein ENF92_07975 [Desulfobacteraceae bacterium]|nr:hypothetical protein [Desulfobacteraceae bacterium]